MANGGIIGPLNPITATNNIGSGVAASYGDLKLFCQNIVSNSNPGSAKGIWSMNDVYSNRKNNTWVSAYTDGEPTAGGTQTINSVSLGSYDFVRKSGGTLSSFTYSDYFTGTNDSRSSVIVFDGNLTIDSGVTIVPRNRKLFTCIYVNGNLTLNGDVEMTLRGANHSSGSGSNIASSAIKIAPGPFSPSVTDPNIPSSGEEHHKVDQGQEFKVELELVVELVVGQVEELQTIHQILLQREDQVLLFQVDHQVRGVLMDHLLLELQI